MITPYDEYPVHQSPRPFSEIPSTDYSWDDGHYLGLFDARQGVFVFVYMRVNPNADTIGGAVGINVLGKQFTLRLKQPWRGHFDTSIGPFSCVFVEPLRRIRLRLDSSDVDFAFDLEWIAAGRIYTEPHHLATSRGRRTTDQTRYNQSGTGRGWVEFQGRRFEVEEGSWAGSRDHSWGLYSTRPQLSPDPKWLPPVDRPAAPPGMHWMSWWASPANSGFVSVNETQEGEQSGMNAVMGTPLVGGVDFGVDQPGVDFVAARHEMEFFPGTRVLSRATWHLTDADGGKWRQRYVRSSAWNPIPMVVWSDGGALYTYADRYTHESEQQDYSAVTYDGVGLDGSVIPGMNSIEYLAEVETTAPDGTTTTGSGHMEFTMPGRYQPYGFD